MSHFQFFDYQSKLVNHSYHMCESLIKDVCKYLDVPTDKQLEITKKFLDHTHCKQMLKYKAKKDPHAVKQARNPYILFSSDKREIAQKNHPDMKPKELMRELSKMWKEADETTKKTYVQKSVEDKARYERELQENKNNSSEFIGATNVNATV
jgi:hypothetical protein